VKPILCNIMVRIEISIDDQIPAEVVTLVVKAFGVESVLGHLGHERSL